MAKKTSKDSAASDAGGEAPKGRSKVKLALFALAPLLLAGAGYAGWTLFVAAPAPAEAAAHGEAEAHTAEAAPKEPPLELLAETSFTHSLALAVMIRNECGKVYVPDLVAASEAEAKESGQLVNLSWMAAARRIGPLTEKTCGHLLAEIGVANEKAASKAQQATQKAAKAEDGGHH